MCLPRRKPARKSNRIISCSGFRESDIPALIRAKGKLPALKKCPSLTGMSDRQAAKLLLDHIGYLDEQCGSRDAKRRAEALAALRAVAISQYRQSKKVRA